MMPFAYNFRDVSDPQDTPFIFSSNIEGEPLVLLNPGPVLTSPRVRHAMSRTDLCHRDEAFSEQLEVVHAGLKRVAHAHDYDALLVAGGGTAATEAVCATFLRPEKSVLVISNGAFGERIAEITAMLRVPTRHLRLPWGEQVPLDAVERLLENDCGIGSAIMVHHETSTGRINPVASIGGLLAARQVRFILDVVSSLGAEEFDAADFGVDVVIGSANKCLHSVPGLGFVLVHPSMWDEVADVPARSVYMDLRRYRVAAKQSQTPFTPAVHPVLALAEALRELHEEGGPTARRKRYLALNARLRNGLEERGIKLAFQGHAMSASVVVAEIPAGESFAEFYSRLRGRGFVIYGAKGELKERCFIVANMGYLNGATIDRFLDSVALAKAPNGAAATD
jgi:2-aminoethylphosphonate-pyruvate transaminase